jgi:DNA end-binding protein Ku
MEILEFVKAEEVDAIYFETSYYLVPEEAGKKPYALLARALDEAHMLGIAKLTMHNREYTVILRPQGGGIMLHTMYYADEVRVVEQFGKEDVEVREAEVKMAHQLIQALAGKFDPQRFHDTFQDNLRELIKAKLEGKEVKALPRPKPAPVTDLMAALKQSLDQMEKKKPAQRVSEAQAATETEVRPAKKRAGKKKAA